MTMKVSGNKVGEFFIVCKMMEQERHRTINYAVGGTCISQLQRWQGTALL